MARQSPLICFFIDPPAQLRVPTDSSIRLMRSAQAAGYQVTYFCPMELFYENGRVNALLHFIELSEDDAAWYQEKEQKTICLYDVDAVIIRIDPPFDQNYLYATYLLDLVTQHNVLVSNAPQGIRDANEKIFATHFAELMPPTLISGSLPLLKKFLAEHKKIVLKALNNRGGNEVIFLESDHLSAPALLSMMTHEATRTILAQKFIPEVVEGDKRILLIGGEPIPFVLLRKPPTGTFIANTAAGGIGYVQPLTKQDRALCARLRTSLQDKGLDFVGIDVINGYLTEINVTSPTGLVPIMQETGLDLPSLWRKQIDARLKNR